MTASARSGPAGWARKPLADQGNPQEAVEVLHSADGYEPFLLGYGRIARRRGTRRRGKKKAVVAVGRSILIIVWHLLADDQATFTDLGPGHYHTRAGTQRAIGNHIRGPHALGYQVTLHPAGSCRLPTQH